MPNDLRPGTCRACEGGVQPLSAAEIDAALADLPGWIWRDNGLEKTFQFRNFYETMAFVNALAWIAHREDHHPDLQVSYNRCTVRYCTHAVGGVTENDLICARAVMALVQ
ncbi:4a-hydroxytetrahydrobiopterin dehydratase [Acidithiobacillus sp. AMEEHan]|uniref:4a-hydroxytetrahydrobiopterin dehydratase n=1 Tax=Acidithiobacillus sp. AMEEHan TaxID=2994951 RepID=UPI0027E53AB1|nr:4a-hydroxytetrahydrobiopterin dehydratase [Acidithiobacillus sp. AMEEHan]